MIGKIPAVLKMKMQINRANCFFVPDFQSAIPFQIISRIIRMIINDIIHPLIIAGTMSVMYGVDSIVK